MTLRVELVVPDRELWAGEARTVIAKTTEGDIGVLTGHSPVFGVLAEGSLVEILCDGADPVRAFATLYERLGLRFGPGAERSIRAATEAGSGGGAMRWSVSGGALNQGTNEPPPRSDWRRVYKWSLAGITSRG